MATPELFRAALAARDAFGKLSDLIHAAAIALALSHILEPGEQLIRPSLAAGSTPDRLFDVETSRRFAEFKLSRWDGHDRGRQQPTVKGPRAPSVGRGLGIEAGDPHIGPHRRRSADVP